MCALITLKSNVKTTTRLYSVQYRRLPISPAAKHVVPRVLCASAQRGGASSYYLPDGVVAPCCCHPAYSNTHLKNLPAGVPDRCRTSFPVWVVLLLLPWFLLAYGCASVAACCLLPASATYLLSTRSRRCPHSFSRCCCESNILSFYCKFLSIFLS